MSSDRRGFLREIARTAREVRGVSGAGRDALAEARGALLGDEPAAEPEEEALPERDPGRLSPAEEERYAEQLAAPGWSTEAQLALREASVLVVGAGALGSPVAFQLAGAGVGRLGIVDDAAVALGDLAREPLHFTPDAGVAKAHSAAAKLGFLNPEVEVVPYAVRFAAATAAGLLAGHDLVVAAADPLAVNAAACRAGVPLVAGGAAAPEGLGGWTMGVRPGETACLRCAGMADAAPGAALGPVAGAIGSLMALEALRRLTGFAPPLEDAVLRIDLAAPALVRAEAPRRAGCPDCGAY